MLFKTESSPHIGGAASVSLVMRRVLYALVPGTALYIAYFGWGMLFNIAIAVIVAVGAEAAMLAARGRPIRPFVTDLSAVVTAWLMALALPSLAPWWLPALGSVFAIVLAKHLYGGLGQNPFNPAMVGYVILLVSFPREMTQWISPEQLREAALSLAETARYVFTGELPAGLTWDSLSMATPLDTIKTGLNQQMTVEEITASPVFGSLAGTGWEWIALLWLAGGVWLLWKRVIQWQVPVAMLGALAAMATVFYALDPDTYASPLVHLLSGGSILGAFFIATDPVSGSTTPRGRILFGAGIGIFTYVIRTWGGYPDGVAFAVLLMNMAVPVIDYYTQPRVFGHRS